MFVFFKNVNLNLFSAVTAKLSVKLRFYQDCCDLLILLRLIKNYQDLSIIVEISRHLLRYFGFYTSVGGGGGEVLHWLFLAFLGLPPPPSTYFYN